MVKACDNNNTKEYKERDTSLDSLRVKATTDVKKLANAIWIAMRDRSVCEVISIGAAAVNQAVKGLASANGLISTNGYKLNMTPFFRTITLTSGEAKTAIVFMVTKEQIPFLS